VDALREQTHDAYAAWIAQAKASGELQSDIPTQTAALYVDAQLGNAMTQLRRGDPVDSAKSVVELALSVFLQPGSRQG
jgi:hypothetical protein